MEEKIYLDIPEEIIDIMFNALAYLGTRGIYAKLPFGFKKAVKCTRKYNDLRSIFWSKVNELYPEVYKKYLINYEAGKVSYKKSVLL